MLYAKTSDIARWCDVDIKTVHNWVDKGKLPEGPRTPGGHLRFHLDDVRAFLTRHGYPVPAEIVEVPAS